MVYVIIGIFAVAAVVGLVIANAIISGRPATPKPAVIAHGLLAVTGLGLFIYYALEHRSDYPKLSLILFIVAAVGGIVLLINDLVRKKPGPVAVVVVHALVAIAAFALLLVYALF